MEDQKLNEQEEVVLVEEIVVEQIDDMEEYDEECEKPKKVKLSKFEKKLVKNKFKMKWLSDGSGYWFQRKFKFPIFEKLRCVVEPDRDLVFFEIYSNDGELVEKRFEVKNWKQCKKLLKKFDLI